MKNSQKKNTTTPSKMKSFKNPVLQFGTSLIEILVTVVIIAIGLLGLAVMQNISVKAGYDSYLRTQASFLAYDIIDRIRANPSATAYALNATDTLPTTVPSPSCFNGGSCTVNQMRSFDLYYWQKNALELLPDSKLSIELDVDTNLYTVDITWNDRADNDETTTAETTAGKVFSYHFQIDN